MSTLLKDFLTDSTDTGVFDSSVTSIDWRRNVVSPESPSHQFSRNRARIASIESGSAIDRPSEYRRAWQRSVRGARERTVEDGGIKRQSPSGEGDDSGSTTEGLSEVGRALSARSTGGTGCFRSLLRNESLD